MTQTGETALTLRFLGDVEVARNGERLALPRSKKTRALLAYLAMAERPHRRDRLCALLWDIPDDPRGALRWSLSKLRPLVDEPGTPRIVADRENVAFQRHGAHVDLLALKERFAQDIETAPPEELEEAVAAFRGEFLEGLDLSECHEFRAWCVAEREEARLLHVKLLNELIGRLSDQPERAIHHARALTEVDPHDETARATLARLLDAARAPAAATGTDERANHDPAPVLDIPDKPSIAVLPFDNMSGDPDQEYFADGIAEDIITALSRFRWFFVIARNSSFTYRGRHHDVKQISRDLGVQYILEGSVRKGGNQVRVTAQLIDATSGHHVWAERYDRELADIFAVQDEITQKIISSVAPEFLSAEARRAQRKDVRNLDTWDLIMRARWHQTKFEKDHNAEAQRLLRKAIELDAGSALAHSSLAFSHVYDALYGWGESVSGSIAQAAEAAQRAVSIDDRDSWAQATLGRVDLLRNRHRDSVHRLERAIELNPNDPYPHGQLGLTLGLSGEPDRAAIQVEEALRLSPRDPLKPVWLGTLAITAFYAGRYEEAAERATQAIQANPQHAPSYRILVASYAALDRKSETEAALADLMSQQPGLTVTAVDDQAPPNRDRADKERYLAALRKAGLPD